MVQIKRNTGFSGAGSRITVYINDEKAAAIKQNKQVELEIPSDEAKVSVSQFGVHSNELLIKDGQVVEITTRPWTYISIVLFFILLSSASIYLPSPYRLIVSILLIVAYIGLYQFVNGFKLEVVYP